MKKTIFMLYCMVCCLIFAEKEIEKNILFEYEEEYMQYSYLNFMSCLGCIKTTADMKKLVFNDDFKKIPYDGFRITLTKEKKLIYLSTRTQMGKLENKTKTIEYSEYLNSNFSKQLIIVSSENNKFKKNEVQESETSAQYDFELDERNYLVKEIKYIEIEIPEALYDKLVKQIGELNGKIKQYFEISNGFPRTRVERKLYEVKLDYVTQIKTNKNNIIFFNEDTELLKENKNEIYILVEELRKELESYIKAKEKK